MDPREELIIFPGLPCSQVPFEEGARKLLYATPKPALGPVRRDQLGAVLVGELGMLWAREGPRDPVRSPLFFLAEFEYEMFRKGMQLGWTTFPVCPGHWVFLGCGNFGVKNRIVLGKLDSVGHPRCREYAGQKLRPANRDFSKQKPWRGERERGERGIVCCSSS